MKTAADFRVIHAQAQKLEPDKPLTCTFEMPGHLARGDQRCVIFVKYFLEGASALTWDLHLNGSRLLENSGSGSHLLMTMQAFDANLLLPGENRIEVRFTHGVGTVRIADMMVQFHVSV